MKEVELLALSSAHKVYPDAKLLLWTEQGSCTNAPPYVELSYLSEAELGLRWHPEFEPRTKTDLSNIIRLKKLYQYGGLYIDSDAVSLKPWHLVTDGEQYHLNRKLCIARYGKTSILNNGVLYAPQPELLCIANWLLKCEAEAYRRRNHKQIKMDYFSAVVPEKFLADQLYFDHLQGKVHAPFGARSAEMWPKKLEKLPDLSDLCFVHFLGSNAQLEQLADPDCAYQQLLARLKQW